MQDGSPITSHTFDVNLIDPHTIRLFHEPEGDARVRAQVGDALCHVDVHLARALPLSDPDHYLGLRDSTGKDLGMVREWNEIEPESLKIALAALDRSYLLPKVLTVNKVDDSFGVVIWDVVTDRGPRRYTVRNIRDNSVTLSASRVLMTDVEGDRFEFPDIHAVGPAALEVLLKVL